MRLHNFPAPGLSRRSRTAIAILGATWRPFTFLVPTNRAGIVASRALFRGTLALVSRPVSGSTFDRVEQAGSAGGIVRGEWVRTPGTTRDDGAILHLHGSAYVLCSSRTHRGLTSHLGAATGLPVFSIDYRLSPSHRYPAASQDVRAAWDWLLAEGYDPARIVIVGDSAGGQLAISLALELARTGEPLPAALVTLSPVIDLSLRSAIVRDRIEYDPFAPASVARRMLEQYADADAQQDEGLRIGFDDIEDFPPTLVHCGSREMLAADCTELARRIRGAGFLVEHRSWPGQMHVFQALTALMPESREALEEIRAFVDAHMPAASVQTQPKRTRLSLAAGA